MSVTRWDEDANPELAWFDEATIEDLERLRASAIDELGESVAAAQGLVGWVIGKDANAVSKVTRSAYRRILREVGPPGPPSRRARHARAGPRGHAGIRMLASVAAGGSVLAIAAQSGPVGACAAALASVPITLDESPEAPETAIQRLAVAA